MYRTRWGKIEKCWIISTKTQIEGISYCVLRHNENVYNCFFSKCNWLILIYFKGRKRQSKRSSVNGFTSHMLQHPELYHVKARNQELHLCLLCRRQEPVYMTNNQQPSIMLINTNLKKKVDSGSRHCDIQCRYSKQHVRC